jgi:hypothetical protein
MQVQTDAQMRELLTHHTDHTLDRQRRCPGHGIGQEDILQSESVLNINVQLLADQVKNAPNRHIALEIAAEGRHDSAGFDGHLVLLVQRTQRTLRFNVFLKSAFLVALEKGLGCTEEQRPLMSSLPVAIARWRPFSAHVKPYGKHLLIQMHRDDNVDTIARLTETGRNTYSSAFRSHTGRWEPLPGTGDLAMTADLVATLLATYFDPKY